MIVRRKKSIIGWVAAVCGFSVLAVVLVTGLFVIDRDAAKNRVSLENMYRNGFYQLMTGVNNMEVSLSKLAVSNESTATAQLAGDAYRSSLEAVNGLSVMPLDPETYFKTSRFLNQAGDLCASYSRKLGAEECCDGYDDMLDKVYRSTVRLNDAIKEVSSNQNDDYSYINAKLADFAPLSLSGDTKSENAFEYPELIYDGPFSDSQEKKCFKGLEAYDNINEADGEAIARKTFAELGLKDIRQVGSSREPDAFNYVGTTKNGKSMYVSVSEKGGKIMAADVGDTVAIVRLNEDAVTEKAIAYAAACGYEGLEPVWFSASEGVAYVNLAAVEEGVILYTDLVKVKVGQDDGKFLGIEALGYCTNHANHSLNINISVNTALNAVSKKLKVSGIRKALIPLNGKEVMTYEISGSYNGLDYFIYVDGISGKQVNILRTIDQNQGRLVI